MALNSEPFKPASRPSQDQLAEIVQQFKQTTDHSSQDTTLQELQEQARSVNSQGSTKSKRRKMSRRPSRRGIPMRDEFFSKTGWTRSFTAEPIHNPHKVWCHMCEKNFSIWTKGPIEILRHHRTEKHVRRDQRWRYEHLKSTDRIAGKVHHRVRGRKGKILTKRELAKELPKVIHTELMDVGERFSFYDDFVQGRTTALDRPESRSRTQLRIVADFLGTQGDFSVLRNLWARLSSLTDHQASDFDWGEEHMTVNSSLLVDSDR